MERTFKILVKGKVRGKEKIVSLPCRGSLPLTGCDALEIMRSYKKKKPGVEIQAVTENKFAEDGYETLTTEEMEALFGEETDARQPWERYSH